MLKNNYPAAVWKHCPYCGSVHIDWKGETKSMHCRNCKRTFFINASAAVVALIQNEKGELLFTRRKFDPAKDTLDLPGGFVDLMETAEDAVKREIKEELNLDITALQYYASFPNRYLYDNIVYFTLDMAFWCTIPDFSTIQVNDDVSDYVFIHPEKVNLQDIGLESARSVITRINTKTAP